MRSTQADQRDGETRNEQLESRGVPKGASPVRRGAVGKGRVRTSSAAYPTHILGAMRAMTRLETVTETLRQVLTVLAPLAPD